MMQLRIEKFQINPIPQAHQNIELIGNLIKKLDNDKFFGKIILSFQCGNLEGVRVEQNLTLSELKKELPY